MVDAAGGAVCTVRYIRCCPLPSSTALTSSRPLQWPTVSALRSAPRQVVGDSIRQDPVWAHDWIVTGTREESTPVQYPPPHCILYTTSWMPAPSSSRPSCCAGADGGRRLRIPRNHSDSVTACFRRGSAHPQSARTCRTFPNRPGSVELPTAP